MRSVIATQMMMMASAPSFVYSTWNPLDASPTIILSNGNSRATGVATTYQSVRSQSAVSGKQYFELLHNVVTTGGNSSAGGLSDGTQSLASPNYCGVSNLSVGFWVPPGGVYQNGATIGAGLGAQPVGVSRSEWAVDSATRKVWVRLHGGAWLGGGDPALGTSPTATLSGTGGIFAMATPFVGGGWYVDLVSNPANMTGSAPSGFTAGL